MSQSYETLERSLRTYFLAKNLGYVGGTSNAFEQVPNGKHIEFVQNQLEQDRSTHLKLVGCFDSHGVRCHVTHELTCNEIMKLDYTCNGPMNSIDQQLQSLKLD